MKNDNKLKSTDIRQFLEEELASLERGQQIPGSEIKRLHVSRGGDPRDTGKISLLALQICKVLQAILDSHSRSASAGKVRVVIVRGSVRVLTHSEQSCHEGRRLERASRTIHSTVEGLDGVDVSGLSQSEQRAHSRRTAFATFASQSICEGGRRILGLAYRPSLGPPPAILDQVDP